jgi:hypothetical protein
MPLEIMRQVAIGVYVALTDAIGPELTRKANANLRDALADGQIYHPVAAAILETLAQDEDDATEFAIPAKD